MDKSKNNLDDIQQALSEHGVVIVFNAALKVTYVNSQFSELSQYTPEELSAKKLELLFDRHDSNLFQECVDEIKQEKVWKGILPCLRKDEKKFWLKASIVPVKGEDGCIEKYITIATDITRQERIRLAMERLAIAASGIESYSLIVRALCDGLDARWAGLGELINGGRQVQVLSFWADGKRGDTFVYDLAGTPCSDVCTKENPLVISNSVAELYPEDQMLVDIGAKSYRGEPLQDEENNIFGILFVIDDKSVEEDVSERALLRLASERAMLEIRRERDEEDLQSNRNKLAQAQRMANLGSWSFDYISKELVWSDEMYRIFGLDPFSMSASFEVFLDAIHPDDVHMVNETIIQSIEQKESYSIKYRLLLPDGATKWIQAKGEVKYDNEGVPLRCDGYVHDITEQERLERDRELISQGAVIAAESQSLNDALKKNLKLVCDYTGWPIAHVYMRDHQQEKMISSGIWHLNCDEQHEEFRGVTSKYKFEQGYGLPGRIWNLRRPEWIRDVRIDDNFPRAKACEHLTLQGAFGFPIIIDGEVEAVMEVFDTQPFEPNKQIESTLVLYGEQIGRIFERHLRENKLKESEERLNLALSAANDGLWDWDLATGTVYYSPRWMSMLGYEESELPGELATWENLVDDKGKQRTMKIINECANGDRTSFEVEFRMRHKQGHYVDVLSRGAVVRNEKGDAIRITGTHVDISDRKNTERALIESRSYLREERDFVDAVLTAAGTVIVVLDKRGSIVRFNKAAEEITGYQFIEVYNKPVWEVFISPEIKEDVKGVFDCLIEGNIIDRYENEWVIKDGSRRLFDWRNTVLQDEKGDIEYLIAQGMDITDQREAEKTIENDNEQKEVVRALLEMVTLKGSDIKETLTNCLEKLFQVSLFNEESCGAIFLLDEQSNELKLKASYNIPSDESKECQNTSIGCCHCGESISLDKLNYIQNIDNDDPCFPIVGNSSCYTLPLVSSEGVQGVLSLFMPTDYQRHEVVEHFFSSVADIIASYISRKRQQQIIVDRESMYRSIAETSYDGFWLADSKGNILEVNETYTNISGYSKDELCQMSIYQLDTSQSKEKLGERLNQVMDIGHDLFETVHLTKDGNEVSVEISVSYWPVSGGRFFVFVRDISERKRTEQSLVEYRDHLEGLVATQTEELRASYLQLESIIENLPAVFYIKDLAGRYTMVNRRFEEIAGLDKDRVIGRKDAEIFSNDVVACLPSPEELVFDTDAPVTLEEQFLHADGGIYDYLTTRLPLLDDNGNAHSYMGIMADISQLKHLQRDLSDTMEHLERRASLEHLVSEITHQLIGVDHVSLGDEIQKVLKKIGQFTLSGRCYLIELDLMQQYLSVTHQWCSVGVQSTIDQVQHIHINEFQFVLDQLQNDEPFEIICPEKIPVRDCYFKRLMIDGNASSALLLPIMYAGCLRGIIVLESMGEEPGWNKDDLDLLKTQGVLLGQVLESVETEREIRASRDEAEHSAQVKSEFLANMSHEIRTPLNAVLGIAQIGLRDNTDKKAKIQFERILGSGKHLLGLVNDILDYSKLEAGKLNVENVPYMLGDAIDQALEFVSGDAFKKDIALHIYESPDLPQRLLGDPMRVTQVLANLLGNSIKFTEKGKVVLNVQIEAGVLVLSVTDSGIGMDNDQLMRLFEPFEQADSSTTRRFGGSGLGLAISQRLIHSMGGTIQPYSVPGRGTHFEVRLPVVELPVEKANIAHYPIFYSVGLLEREEKSLKKQLSNIGATLSDLTLKEATLSEEPGCILVASGQLESKRVLRSLIKAIDRDFNVVILTHPGVKLALPDELFGKVSILEWPVRLRHVLKSLNEVQGRGQSGGYQRLIGQAILAVEDTEMNRILLDDILQHEGAEVVFAENGKIAVELVEKDPNKFDLILMDIQMPVMDGYQATGLIKEINENIPIVGITAHAFAEEKRRCEQAGMVAHVPKPIEIDSLVTTILNYVEQQDIKPELLTMNHDSDDSVIQQEVVTEEGYIDWSALLERYSGRPDFIEKILNVMKSNYSSSVEELHAAIDESDYETIAFLSHRLKGVVGNIMAVAVAEQAAQTELGAKSKQEGTFDNAARLADMMATLLTEVDEGLDKQLHRAQHEVTA